MLKLMPKSKSDSMSEAMYCAACTWFKLPVLMLLGILLSVSTVSRAWADSEVGQNPASDVGDAGADEADTDEAGTDETGTEDAASPAAAAQENTATTTDTAADADADADADGAPTDSAQEREWDDDNDAIPTDLDEDPANEEWNWEVQESPEQERPFVNRMRPLQDERGGRNSGGKPVPDRGTPWLAAMYWNRPEPAPAGRPMWAHRHWCGGVLIYPDWVLTAAHCTLDAQGKPKNMADLRVKVGSEDLQSNDGVDFHIDRIVKHAQYARIPRPQTPNMYDNDLALLHIVYDGPPRQFDRNQIRPIDHISASPAAAGNLVTTSNWYRYHDTDGERAMLIKFEMQVRSQAECREYEGHEQPWKLNNDVYCADNVERTICGGDSGSPVILTNGAPTLVGITSWGRDTCSLLNEVGVYTQVAPYVEWIRSAIAAAQQAGPSEAFMEFALP